MSLLSLIQVSASRTSERFFRGRGCECEGCEGETRPQVIQIDPNFPEAEQEKYLSDILDSGLDRLRSEPERLKTECHELREQVLLGTMIGCSKVFVSSANRKGSRKL